MLGFRGIILDLHAKTTDVNINDFFLAIICFAPNLNENIASTERCIGICEKIFFRRIHTEKKAGNTGKKIPKTPLRTEQNTV